MRPHLTCLAGILACLGALACGPGLAAADVPVPGKLQAAGNPRAAWVLRHTPPEAYDLVAKPAGSGWRWVARALQGRPVTAVALEDQLHVLLDDRQYVVFDLESLRPSPGLTPNDPRWPETAKVLAACPSGPLAGVRGAATIVVVLATSAPASRPAASGPASTASAPARASESMALFCLQGGRWTFLADVPAPVGKVLAASLDGQLYLLLYGSGPAQILIRDRAGAWLPPKPMPELLPADFEPLAFAAVKDALLLARRHKDPAATRPAAGEVSLLTIEKDLRVSPPAPIVMPAPHQIGAGVLAIPFADGLAFIWPQPSAPAFAACEPNAAVRRVDTIDLLGHTPDDGRAQQALDYFLYALFALFLLCTFLRMRQGRVIFALPMGVRPARIGRRVAAALIDLVPFTFLGYALFPFPLPEAPATAAEVRDFILQQPVDLNAALFVVASFLLHGIYCVGMETHFGATLGKRLFGLRVVGAGGRRALPFEVLYRGVLRVLEMGTPPGLAMGLGCLLMTRYHQRVGDLLAQTAVVEGTPTPTFPPGQSAQPTDESPPPPPPA